MAAPKSKLNVSGSEEYGKRRAAREEHLRRSGASAAEQKEGAEMYAENQELWKRIRDEKVRRNFTARDAHKALKKAS